MTNTADHRTPKPTPLQLAEQEADSWARLADERERFVAYLQAELARVRENITTAWTDVAALERLLDARDTPLTGRAIGHPVRPLRGPTAPPVPQGRQQ